MLDQFKKIKDISWQEIFCVWKNNEGSDVVWQVFAKKEKGWDSWEAWRGYQSSQINAAQRQWELFELLDGNETIPKCVMGPFRGWQKHYPEEEWFVHTFADLVRNHTAWVSDNVGVKSRREHFPEKTQFIGLYVEDEEVIVIFEGHHRAAALALSVFEGKPLAFVNSPTIALTKISSEEKKQMNNALIQGSKR